MIAYLVITGDYEDEVIILVTLSETEANICAEAHKGDYGGSAVYMHNLSGKPDHDLVFAVTSTNGDIEAVFKDAKAAEDYIEGYICQSTRDHYTVVDHHSSSP